MPCFAYFNRFQHHVQNVKGMLHVSGTPGTPNIPLSHEISGVCSSNLVDVLLPSGILATYPEPVCLKVRQLFLTLIIVLTTCLSALYTDPLICGRSISYQRKSWSATIGNLGFGVLGYIMKAQISRSATKDYGWLYIHP